MWFSFVLDDYDDLNWRGEMAAMFTLLDKLGITVEKVTCHHFSGDRRFLGTDPEPNAKLAKSIQHCSRVEHGTLTLHLNLFGFGQIERSWDGFKFKSSFPTSFCWHLASTSSPFLGAFPVPTDQVPPRHWRPVAALLTLRAFTTPGGGAGAAGADFDEGRDGGGSGGGGTGGEAGPRGGAVAWSWGVGDWDF